MLKTQNLTAEQIQLEQEIKQQKEENKQLKDIIQKISILDPRRCEIAETLAVKSVNQQRAQISLYVSKRRKLEQQYAQLKR